MSDRKRNGKGTRLSAGYTVYKEAVWLSICKIQRPTTHAVAVAWPRQKTIGCQIIQRSDLWLWSCQQKVSFQIAFHLWWAKEGENKNFQPSTLYGPKARASHRTSHLVAIQVSSKKPLTICSSVDRCILSKQELDPKNGMSVQANFSSQPRESCNGRP